MRLPAPSADEMPSFDYTNGSLPDGFLLPPWTSHMQVLQGVRFLRRSTRKLPPTQTFPLCMSVCDFPAAQRYPQAISDHQYVGGRTFAMGTMPRPSTRPTKHMCVASITTHTYTACTQTLRASRRTEENIPIMRLWIARRQKPGLLVYRSHLLAALPPAMEVANQTPSSKSAGETAMRTATSLGAIDYAGPKGNERPLNGFPRMCSSYVCPLLQVPCPLGRQAVMHTAR